MKAHHRVCLHQNGSSRSSIIEIILLVGLGECARDLTKCVPRVPEDFFFLSILMVRGKAASTRREVPRRKSFNLISTGLFNLRYFEDGPLEPGCKMYSLPKKKTKTKTLTWSPQKRSRPALTYQELLSNFIFPLDPDNSTRICSACRIALTSSKYEQSAWRLMEVNTFNFLCFEILFNPVDF